MNSPHSILIVDDEPHMLRYVRTILEVDDYSVETASSGREALQRLQKSPRPDLVLLDMLMPGMDGLETLRHVREIASAPKVVMLSCMTDPRTIVQAMRLGACDYIPKPFQRAELDAALQRHLPDRSFKSPIGQQAVLSEELDNESPFVAASEAMRKVCAQVNLLADVDVPVLLLGESGTGKGVVASLIHRLSSRSQRPFLKVNCAALPADLLESELFGYEAGAFTGAAKSKPGKFEQCDKGTILLDEIGELPPSLQAKLLHVLQDKEFSRLGSRSVVRVDVRIIAATNVDIPQALASKKLREDLYYRLNAFTIQLPPLREQREAIPVLMRYFMSRSASEFGRDPQPLTDVLLEAASRYNWPGNVRELENLAKRYLIIRDEAQILKELGSGKPETAGCSSASSATSNKSKDLKSLVRGLKSEAEMEAISRTLEQTRWNRKEAARLLSISYKALLYKIRMYGLEKTDGILVGFFGWRAVSLHMFGSHPAVVWLLAFVLTLIALAPRL